MVDLTVQAPAPQTPNVNPNLGLYQTPSRVGRNISSGLSDASKILANFSSSPGTERERLFDQGLASELSNLSALPSDPELTFAMQSEKQKLDALGKQKNKTSLQHRQIEVARRFIAANPERADEVLYTFNLGTGKSLGAVQAEVAAAADQEREDFLNFHEQIAKERGISTAGPVDQWLPEALESQKQFRAVQDAEEKLSLYKDNKELNQGKILDTLYNERAGGMIEGVKSELHTMLEGVPLTADGMVDVAQMNPEVLQAHVDRVNQMHLEEFQRVSSLVQDPAAVNAYMASWDRVRDEALAQLSGERTRESVQNTLGTQKALLEWEWYQSNTSRLKNELVMEKIHALYKDAPPGTVPKSLARRAILLPLQQSLFAAATGAAADASDAMGQAGVTDPSDQKKMFRANIEMFLDREQDANARGDSFMKLIVGHPGEELAAVNFLTAHLKSASTKPELFDALVQGLADPVLAEWITGSLNIASGPAKVLIQSGYLGYKNTIREDVLEVFENEIELNLPGELPFIGLEVEDFTVPQLSLNEVRIEGQDLVIQSEALSALPKEQQDFVKQAMDRVALKYSDRLAAINALEQRYNLSTSIIEGVVPEVSETPE